MDPQIREKLEVAKRAVVRVAEGGRGFVVEAGRFERRHVITAAHCLPHLPPCSPVSQSWERTYPNLLGPCDEPAVIYAECLFADPIGDIAVLGPPDEDNLSEEYRAYEELMESTAALPISVSAKEGHAWLLSLGNRWFQCNVKMGGHHATGSLWLSNASEGIEGGMSGSPILSADGEAIGVVSVGGGERGEVHAQGGPNPQIRSFLPPRLI